MADLAVKGRVAETMSPPRILLNTMGLEIGFGAHHRLEAGALRPLTWHFPLETLAVPVVFSTGVLPDGRYLPHAVITGWRDVPIAYAGAIDWMISAWSGAWIPDMIFARHVSGEQGWTPIPPPAPVSNRIGKKVSRGLAGQFEQIGSVPVKDSGTSPGILPIGNDNASA
jgi:hypothetical protein